MTPSYDDYRQSPLQTSDYNSHNHSAISGASGYGPRHGPRRTISRGNVGPYHYPHHDTQHTTSSGGGGGGVSGSGSAFDFGSHHQRTPSAGPAFAFATDDANDDGSNTSPKLLPQTLRPGTSPAPLPRTSSLLPPPPSVRYDQARFGAPSNDSDRPRTNHDELRRQEQHSLLRSHSRSSSIGTPLEAVRNLNRWSLSTNSSRASAHRPGVDADPTQFEHPRSPPRPVSRVRPTDQSPRNKLQKNRRRSNSSGTTSLFGRPEIRIAPEPPVDEVPPLVGLPPIQSFSSLEDSFGNNFAPNRWETRSPDAVSIGTAITNDTAYTQTTSRPAPAHYRGNSVAPSLARSNSVASSFQAAVMPLDRDSEGYANGYGHSRNRSQNKGSMDTSISSSSKGKEKQGKPPSQKAMLSRALQRANTAVQLDNAQNYEGARQSYAEACDLLTQVLSRTATDEDKKKLEAIKKTYTSRIDEIDQMGLARPFEGKALPARPESLGLKPGPTLQLEDDDDDTEETATIETATLTRIPYGDRTPSASNYAEAPSPQRSSSRQAYPRNSERSESFTSDFSYGGLKTQTKQYPLQSSFSRSPAREKPPPSQLVLPRPDDPYMPPPLSPRRLEAQRLDAPSQTGDRASPESFFRSDFSLSAPSNGGHARNPSHESNSWLDPIDESGGSTASSVHSRTSSLGFRRKHIRPASGATEAEFDAALDAAVEAAYDDGYEPMESSLVREASESENEDDVIAKAMKRVQLAKERVRQTEMEALEEQQRAKQRQDSNTMAADFYVETSSDEEEEERMLDEMTRTLAGEETAAATGRGPALSDSSGFTNRTWHSSQGSNPPTTATTLATVAEPGPSNGPLQNITEPPAAPPPSGALPEIPTKPGSSAGLSRPDTAQSVRNRRLSGHNPKQLSIETGRNPTGSAPEEERPFTSHSQISPTQPNLSMSPSQDASEKGEGIDSLPTSPSAHPPTLRKNYSSSSLRSTGGRNMSVTHLDDASDPSPSTPLSSGFAANSRLAGISSINTPLTGSFATKVVSSGGFHLFDDTFHSPESPGSPNPLLMDAPAPLEPCPTDHMLRPFWFMRCLYQTLVHPRGGYLSNKLFVPKDVWKVKGVKLRNIEDKISSCDYLTAALMKLGTVDNCDADALLEEMQALEGVLEQLQTTLTRKLGVEVGVQGSNALFKDSTNSAEMEAAINNVPRAASVTGKSFSWRRLRSKNSGAGLASAYSSTKSNGTIDSNGSGVKESPGLLETLPMTAQPTTRPTKRDVTSAQFTGPNAHYMGSLARLFDAAQTIDQIARQVEDPGLRHADKTQVGLELCTRHAAEFFAFYICRFVMTDVTMLLDKFVKRGSEWVLA